MTPKEEYLELEVSILSDRFCDLKQGLKCVHLEETKHSESEHKDNAERHGVFDDALSLITQEVFRGP